VSADLGDWLRGFVAEPAFVARYPYYACVLGRLDPVIDPSVPVMGVSMHEARFYLHINAEYFQRHPEFLRGVLLHEVHHIALGHLSHAKFTAPAHPDLMEIAKEISANEHIEEPLPPAITLRDYERFGLAAGQSTLDRYERLVALRNEGKLPPRLEPRFLDSHLPQPDDPGAPARARALLSDAVDEAEARDPQLQERQARVCGRKPGQLLEALDQLGSPELPIDWRAAVRMFTARVRAPAHTYARPSRRFPSRTGEIPGRIWAPRNELRPRVVVAIDTSASMSAHDLTQVARQLTPLSEHAQLTIAEVDTELQRVYPFDGKLEMVMGRGGTDLRPALARAFLERQRARGLIYFTDGQGPFPESAPGLPVLWVLTGDEPFECPWGQRTRFTRESRA
jgi:predicted metal-dependent peptidase